MLLLSVPFAAFAETVTAKPTGATYNEFTETETALSVAVSVTLRAC